ncbi:VWA domain-containing protein [uncultured Sphingomonas sp.]|uniref:vWA domain-containing protein n=1 Tax=uncultured Sphingomonas sp. TaxID=158754 RepID=UPI0025E2890C|nr:VWA domain-containing protein [uncultured Sphingomonas sp.]
MTRARFARPVLLAALGLPALFVVGCADTTQRTGAETPVPVTQEAANDIVLTGSRATAPNEPAPPPPPPPPPMPAPVMMMSAQRIGMPLVPHAPPFSMTGRDRFTPIKQNAFQRVAEAPVSTFSLDVDTASYAFVRASLNRGTLPPRDAVRTEELVNYFPYDYAPAKSAAEPFSTDLSVFPSPWAPGRLIVRVGVRGYDLTRTTRPRANLVFLVDTSGSMMKPNKLPLVKQSLTLLLDSLGEDDRVAIVAYAGQAGTVLEPTPASDRTRILAALDRLEAGGSTAGAEGIRQAYALAERDFDPKGVNRVILATDGDFNVGITDQDQLKGYIEAERTKGVYLSVLGFGMGNYNDALMQTLAQNGNGVAAYIDTLNEARKTLVTEASASLFPIAKDVKVQVEFNPAAVAEYRLIGYENRLLAREDFNNDKVDAGDVGAGRTVTALYEVVPVGGPRTVDPLRYGKGAKASAVKARVAELGFVKIRYKLPKASTSRLIARPIPVAHAARFADAPRDARFATAVAGFAELLRGGTYEGRFGCDDVARIAVGAKGADPFGYRAEFIDLVAKARAAQAMPPLVR